MKRRIILIFAVVGIVILTQLFGGCASEEKETISYQKIVDDFKNLLPYEVPEHLQQENCSKNGTEFDVNGYFSVLTSLSMQDGYVLDFVYLFESMGGHPVLYVRAASQPPYLNYEEYGTEMLGDIGIGEVYGTVTPLWNEATGVYEDKVRIDDSDEGFFQYIVLQVLGEQFYLWWHANYNDWRIICEASRIEAIIDEVMNSGYQEGTPPDFAEKARDLDAHPMIEYVDDMVKVSMLIFTDWGGFKRLTFVVKRDYPHTIVDYQSETLVEYDCGIRF